MAASKQSKFSQSITIRVPNNVYEQVIKFGEENSIFKFDGEVNTSETVNTLLKQALGIEDTSLITVPNISNTHIEEALKVLQNKVNDLYNMLSNTVQRSEIDILQNKFLQEARKLIESKSETRKQLSLVPENEEEYKPEIVHIPKDNVITDNKTNEDVRRENRRERPYKPKGLKGEILTLEEEIPESEAQMVNTKALIEMLNKLEYFDKWRNITTYIKMNKGNKWQMFNGLAFKSTDEKESTKPGGKGRSRNLWLIKNLPKEADISSTSEAALH